MPEVIFAMGRLRSRWSAIAGRLLDNAPNVLITRADTATADFVAARIPGSEYFPPPAPSAFGATVHFVAKAGSRSSAPGTSDIPVARKRNHRRSHGQ